MPDNNDAVFQWLMAAMEKSAPRSGDLDTLRNAARIAFADGVLTEEQYYEKFLDLYEKKTSAPVLRK